MARAAQYLQVLVRLRTEMIIAQVMHVEPPGESWRVVARKLGVDGSTLYRAMARGVFQIRHVWHLGGRRHVGVTRSNPYHSGRHAGRHLGSNG